MPSLLYLQELYRTPAVSIKRLFKVLKMLSNPSKSTFRPKSKILLKTRFCPLTFILIVGKFTKT